MCMIFFPVEAVSETIIVNHAYAASDGRHWVFQSYSNTIKLNQGQTNYMMIAVQTPDVNSILFLNSDKDFVQDLIKETDKVFEEEKKPTTSAFGFSFGGSTGSVFGSSYTLPVEKSGSYQVTRVPRLDCFDNLDQTVFLGAKGTIEQIRKKYQNRVGLCFLIMRLDQTAKYHPFNYTYPLQTPGSFLIPTMHIHPKTENQNVRLPFVNSMSFGPLIINNPQFEDWDHSIYFYGMETQQMTLHDYCDIDILLSGVFHNKIHSIDKANNLTSKLIKHILDYTENRIISKDDSKTVSRIKVIGKKRNGDIICTYQLSSSSSSSQHPKGNDGAPTPMFSQQPKNPVAIACTGVNCDGCLRQSITFPYFHCTKCVNFDLCMHCDGSNVNHDPKHPKILVQNQDQLDYIKSDMYIPKM